MSDTSSSEPTMEEILASIRRIISEDDVPATPEAEVHPEPVHVPPPEPEPVVHPEEDVFELTQKLEPDPPPHRPDPFPAPIADDLEFEPPSRPVVAAPAPKIGPLVSPQNADVAATHFGALAQTVLMPVEGRTLEDVVSELLRPLLKGWLDTYLPGIVEEAVKSEVERISRRRL